MKIISPSLLACDFLNIEKELEAFKEEKDLWFHLDIMDGHFVPNLTFGQPIVKMICNKSTQPLDAHLMVSNPEFHLETMKDFGLHNFTFHFEATDKPIELIQKYRDHYPSLGVSIKPKTSPEELSSELLSQLDLVLVMSVEPGFGGQSFMENSFDKIKYLDQQRKEHGYTYQIQVDGGVSDKNSSDLFSAGADNLVAGSYIFTQGPDFYQQKIQTLRS